MNTGIQNFGHVFRGPDVTWNYNVHGKKVSNLNDTVLQISIEIAGQIEMKLKLNLLSVPLLSRVPVNLLFIFELKLFFIKS